MKNTVTMLRGIEGSLGDLAHHSLSLERDNRMLKDAIRTIAASMSLTQSGETTLSLTQTEADMLVRVCTVCDIFGTGGAGAREISRD